MSCTVSSYDSLDIYIYFLTILIDDVISQKLRKDDWYTLKRIPVLNLRF